MLPSAPRQTTLWRRCPTCLRQHRQSAQDLTSVMPAVQKTPEMPQNYKLDVLWPVRLLVSHVLCTWALFQTGTPVDYPINCNWTQGTVEYYLGPLPSLGILLSLYFCCKFCICTYLLTFLLGITVVWYVYIKQVESHIGFTTFRTARSRSGNVAQL